MAKVLIDIPEDTRGRLRFGVTYKNDVKILSEALSYGIVFSRLTNGEVLMKMFPQMKLIRCDSSVNMQDENMQYGASFPVDWWNSKWKGEVK